jgi:citrate synthase
MEMILDIRLIRPTFRYVGEVSLPFVSIEQRTA